MKRSFTLNGAGIILGLFLLVLFLSGCANNEVITDCLKGHTYGFWGGLWHGIIAPIDLILSLWNHDITVYAPHNNGALYALGFIIGSGGWGFLGGHGASRSHKRN
jgi:hypothetical protein